MNKYIEWEQVKKILYLSFFFFIFFQIFIHNPFDNWYNKYHAFKVPVYSFPGADSRNIQKAAYCHSQGHDYYNDEKCFKYTTLVPEIYPNNTKAQPRYNYPPVVAKIYEFFDNYSEEFFQKFWILNMLLLVITILIYSYKINYILFPFIIFSPITLLEIERANIDGMIFSMLFLPLMLTASVFLHTLFIAIAASIKIFPAVGFLSLYRKRTKNIKKKIFAILLITPLMISSILYIKEYIKSTQYSFDISFGLFSFKYTPFFHNNLSLSYFLIAIYLLFILIILFFIYKNRYFTKPLVKNIKQLEEKYLNILLLSLLIYIFVFLVFTNWGYRFIFLIPIFLILSNFKDIFSRISFGLIFITFWIPFLPNGWMYFNIMNYILFPFILIVFIFTYKHHYFYIQEITGKI